MENIGRLRDFVQSFTRLVEQVGGDEARIFSDGKSLLSELIAHDDWLPHAFAQPSIESYRQYLLYCDPLERFSVVSFVWSPGQTTPIHDHTVWGMVGVLRGAERCEEYELDEAAVCLRASGSHELPVGGVDLVSPDIGDIHRVSNALLEGVSISIHVYGGNIGAVQRHVYDPDTGSKKPFISGYSNSVMPNIWDRSGE
ncbi:cysteine dioxygenase [Shewanella rhizosphaerae]|uniref:cysteine dioxygenase family protein n=1 Tax=Shewanella rhizosphaerae TaxID=2864207 RepID=UPI001C65BA36|nr:cysteine dioxygenase [Shewanella rhizosphaerae]QYK12697.1 cysteine dioxygenase [Shewanella rhizosphaerae]